jgi:hypothetical protein
VEHRERIAVVDRCFITGPRATRLVLIGCVASALVVSTMAFAAEHAALQGDANARHVGSIFDVAPSDRHPVPLLHGWATSTQPARGKFFYLLS